MLCLERESNPRPSVSCPNVIPLHYRDNPAGNKAILTTMQDILTWATQFNFSSRLNNLQGKLRGSETDAMFKDKYIKYETVFFKHNANSQMQVYSEKLTGSNEGYTLQVKKQIYEMVTCNNGKTSSEKKLMLCLERESNPRPSVSCPNVIPLHYRDNPAGNKAILTTMQDILTWATQFNFSSRLNNLQGKLHGSETDAMFKDKNILKYIYIQT